MNAVFTGVLFGCAVAAPVGPIGLLCIRRTIAGGFLFGLASGLGAACADGAYAALAVAALGVATAAIAHLSGALHIAGGLALMVLGTRIGFAAWRVASVSAPPSVANRGGLVNAFASTFALTIINPTTIVSFSAIVAASGSAMRSAMGGTFFVTGVVAGSAAWWLLLCGGVVGVRRMITPLVIRAIDMASGAALLAWGLMCIIRR